MGYKLSELSTVEYNKRKAWVKKIVDEHDDNCKMRQVLESSSDQCDSEDGED